MCFFMDISFEPYRTQTYLLLQFLTRFAFFLCQVYMLAFFVNRQIFNLQFHIRFSYFITLNHLMFHIHFFSFITLNHLICRSTYIFLLYHIECVCILFACGVALISPNQTIVSSKQNRPVFFGTLCHSSSFFQKKECYLFFCISDSKAILRSNTS